MKTSTSPIPQVDPLAGYLAQKVGIDTAIARVTSSGRYLIGDELRRFEQAFSVFCESTYAVGVANGTDAIELALRAVGIAPGDFVLTTSFTAVASATGILRSGATPIFVDIDPETCNISCNALEDTLRALRKRSIVPRAILVVHLYGQPAQITEVCNIAAQYNLTVIEDCAQSHGARYEGRRVGTFGSVAAFSFYPTKNLGGLGDAGAVVTSNPEIANLVAQMRQYGWNEERTSVIGGVNSRLDELQAAVLLEKLRRLEENNGVRRQIASSYRRVFQDSNRVRPLTLAANTEHVYHQFVVRCTQREDLQAKFAELGVATAIHYPKAVHQNPFFAKYREHSLGLSHAEQASREVLSMPMFPELPEAQLAEVLAVCNSILRQRSSVTFD